MGKHNKRRRTFGVGVVADIGVGSVRFRWNCERNLNRNSITVFRIWMFWCHCIISIFVSIAGMQRHRNSFSKATWSHTVIIVSVDYFKVRLCWDGSWPLNSKAIWINRDMADQLGLPLNAKLRCHFSRVKCHAISKGKKWEKTTKKPSEKWLFICGVG